MSLFNRAATVESAPLAQLAPATERQRAAAATLVRALDQLDLADLLGDTRAALDRARTVGEQFGEARRSEREQYERIRDRVTAGELAPADALTALAAHSPTTSKLDAAWPDLAARLEAETVKIIESQAVHAARRDAGTVHGALSARAAEIVSAASVAAAELLDLAGYVNSARRAMQRPDWSTETGTLRGWPVVDIAAVADARLGTLGTLRGLNRRYAEVRDVTTLLAALSPRHDVASHPTCPRRRVVPDSLGAPRAAHLALADAFRWTPGLWLADDAAARPGEPKGVQRAVRPDHGDMLVRDLTRAAVADVQRQQVATRAGRDLAGVLVPGNRA